MNILTQLSSQIGDKTEKSNKIVSDQCLKKPQFLKHIVKGLHNDDVYLVGDCAEVLTNIAEVKPDLIIPFIDELIPLLSHPTSRVRWEAMHSIACIAELCPKKITPLLPQLKGICITDSSTIVRDHCTILIGNYAKTSKKAAQEAFVALELILEQWKEKQASRVFDGLQNIFNSDPSLKNEIISISKPFEKSKRQSVQKAYKSLLKSI